MEHHYFLAASLDEAWEAAKKEDVVTVDDSGGSHVELKAVSAVGMTYRDGEEFLKETPMPDVIRAYLKPFEEADRAPEACLFCTAGWLL